MNKGNPEMKKYWQQKKLIVSHGGISHPMSEWESCEDCIKTRKDFQDAVLTGDFERLIGITLTDKRKKELLA